MPRTRFAPGPTGLLHLGNAHAALFASREAAGGHMLLRIEDIDRGRCNPEFAAAIEEDLHWLELRWPLPIRRQSEHLDDYATALSRLQALGLVYPCFCSRSDLMNAASAPHEPSAIYPGTCRSLSENLVKSRQAAGAPFALRLDCSRASALAGPLDWRDLNLGIITARPELLGDVILARRDIGTSYHLSVTWDDAFQEIEIVTRGEDLFESTHIHRLLQALLQLPVPVWRHHPLLRDAKGRRFTKRDLAPTLRALRLAGHSPAEVRALAGFPAQA